MSEKFIPRPETLALMPVSGNPINGQGETTQRRANKSGEASHAG